MSPYSRAVAAEVQRRATMDKDTLEIYEYIADHGPVSVSILIAEGWGQIVKQLIERGYICPTASG